MGIAVSTHAKEAGLWRKEKNDTLKGFSSELDHRTMQPATEDLIINQVYFAHSGGFVLFK